MTTPTIYFGANEDESVYLTGGASVITTSGRFRGASFGTRCALACPNGQSAVMVGPLANMSAVTSAWFHARVWMHANSSNKGQGGFRVASPISILDAAGIPRILLYSSNTGNWSSTISSNYTVAKVTASGTVTALGSAPTGWLTGSPTSPDAIDVQIINYGASGTINVYINNVLVFTFTGDIHTDSNTAVCGMRLSGMCDPSGASGSDVNEYDWSEIIISDTDPRTWGVATITAVSNGNTHTFDTGSPAAGNINEITCDDSTYDASSVAAQVDQYVPSAMPVGFQPVAFGVAARAAKGASGPSQIYLGVRSGGADYWSAALPQLTSLQANQVWYSNDPATGLPWTGNPTNFGAESVT